MEKLNFDCMVVIFSYLELRQLVSIRRVSKQFKKVANSDNIWKQHYKNDIEIDLKHEEDHLYDYFPSFCFGVENTNIIEEESTSYFEKYRSVILQIPKRIERPSDEDSDDKLDWYIPYIRRYTIDHIKDKYLSFALALISAGMSHGNQNISFDTWIELSNKSESIQLKFSKFCNIFLQRRLNDLANSFIKDVEDVAEVSRSYSRYQYAEDRQVCLNYVTDAIRLPYNRYGRDMIVLNELDGELCDNMDYVLELLVPSNMKVPIRERRYKPTDRDEMLKIQDELIGKKEEIEIWDWTPKNEDYSWCPAFYNAAFRWPTANHVMSAYNNNTKEIVILLVDADPSY